MKGKVSKMLIQLHEQGYSGAAIVVIVVNVWVEPHKGSWEGHQCLEKALLDIVHYKSKRKAAVYKLNRINTMSFSLKEKEQDALECVQRSWGRWGADHHQAEL